MVFREKDSYKLFRVSFFNFPMEAKSNAINMSIFSVVTRINVTLKYMEKVHAEFCFTFNLSKLHRFSFSKSLQKFRRNLCILQFVPSANLQARIFILPIRGSPSRRALGRGEACHHLASTSTNSPRNSYVQFVRLHSLTSRP